MEVKTLILAVLITIVASPTAMAQVSIEPFDGRYDAALDKSGAPSSPRYDPVEQQRAREERERGLQQARAAPVAPIPESIHALIDEWRVAVAAAKSDEYRKDFYDERHAPPRPVTRQILEDSQCRLQLSTPSGIERRSGGLNGSLSIYDCGDVFAEVYEWDYGPPLKQTLRIFDDDYYHEPSKNLRLIKEYETTSRSMTMTTYGWLNPGYEIKYVIYAPVGHPQDTKLRLRKSLETIVASITE